MAQAHLTLLTFAPIVGALLLFASGRASRGLICAIAALFELVTLGLAIALAVNFDPSSTQLQFVLRQPWIPLLGVYYYVGVDGLGLVMVLLAAIIVPFALWSFSRIEKNLHCYFALMLLLQAGMIGAFTALNFFHWFIFWELSLVPAYFLIKIWGSGTQRKEAATQFFVYTLVGSVTMLLAFIAIYISTGTFDFIRLAELAQGRIDGLAAPLALSLGWYELLTPTLALIIFIGVFLGFAVKVPLMPFHTWAPGTYEAAPPGVAMVLTGVMSKMGVYGFARIVLPIFAGQMRDILPLLLALSVATILFSAWAAIAQRDLKRLLAYSSINHLGYCMLGIFAAAKWTGTDPQGSVERTAILNGVIFQMFAHGLSASALFCFVGFLEARTGRRGIDEFGGLRNVAPIFAGLMGIAIFASAGLPGLSGFVGEFLIFKGSFALSKWAAGISVFALLLTAVFLLKLLQNVFQGPYKLESGAFPDLTVRERMIVAPIIALIFVLGIFPNLLLQFTNVTVKQMVNRMIP